MAAYRRAWARTRTMPTAVRAFFRTARPISRTWACAGPQESILGRQIDRVLTHMLTAMPAPFDVAEGDPRVCGAAIDSDVKTGRATAIERSELKADPNAPPFTAR